MVNSEGTARKQSSYSKVLSSIWLVVMWFLCRNLNLIYSEYCNFACCAVWVRDLVSHFEGGTQTEGF
jgi:hypothetical protein